MKKPAPSILLASVMCFVFFAFAWGACIKDKCSTVVCFNNGVCVDGRCTCPVGYEGADCNTGWQEKFAGPWHADETFIRDTTDAHFKYDLTISGIPDSFKVNGLSDTLDGVFCKRESLYTFSMSPNQVMRADSSIIIRNGQGTFNHGTVTGLYSYKYRDTVISVKFTWTR